MISSLSDLIIYSKVNDYCTVNGLDSIDQCISKDHFISFPHVVTYNYNSRGFRDSEWPTDLNNAIWCIGDSFTAGIGSPIEHTWVNILQTKTNARCVNISLDGASNMWIARRAVQIIDAVKPRNVVLQWSYLHREESPDTSKSDQARRIQYSPENFKSDEHMVSSFEFSVKSVVNAASKNSTNVVFSSIPHAAWMLSKEARDDWQRISNSVNAIPEFKILDYARDFHHYDILTATEFVNSVVPKLSQPLT